MVFVRPQNKCFPACSARTALHQSTANTTVHQPQTPPFAAHGSARERTRSLARDTSAAGNFVGGRPQQTAVVTAVVAQNPPHLRFSTALSSGCRLVRTAQPGRLHGNSSTPVHRSLCPYCCLYCVAISWIKRWRREGGGRGSEALALPLVCRCGVTRTLLENQSSWWWSIHQQVPGCVCAENNKITPPPEFYSLACDWASKVCDNGAMRIAPPSATEPTLLFSGGRNAPLAGSMSFPR